MQGQIKQALLSIFCLFFFSDAFSQYGMKSACSYREASSVHACCLRSNFYVDLGLGMAFFSHFNAEKYMIFDAKDPDEQLSFQLHSYDREQFLPQNFSLGFGYSWRQVFNNNYFLPGISLGLNYQKTNFKKESTAMSFNVRHILKEMSVDLKFKPIFYQDSLFGNVKINLMRFNCLMPYIKTGIGFSWNTMLPESVQSGLIDKEHLEFWMPISRKVAFAFQMGVGVDFLVKENLIVNFGYTYTNLGALQSAKPQFYLYKENKIDEEYSEKFNRLLKRFNFGNLTTHNLEISFRYLFA